MTITREKTAYNSTFAIGGVSCSADSLVVNESFVLRINISGKSPALRVAAKRYKPLNDKLTLKTCRQFCTLVFHFKI